MIILYSIDFVSLNYPKNFLARETLSQYAKLKRLELPIEKTIDGRITRLLFLINYPVASLTFPFRAAFRVLEVAN